MSFAINPKLFAGVMCCGIIAYCKHRVDKREMAVDKLKLNLMYAEEALRHTDFLSEGVHPEQHREALQRIKEEIKPYDLEDKTTEIVAATAKKYQMGTCVEQAAVAYIYLKNEKNLRKIEYHVLAEHAYVVIGKGRTAVMYEPCKKQYFPSGPFTEKVGKEVEIRKWIDVCKKKEGFEELALAVFSTGRGEEILYENCLRERIAKKSKPKQPPSLSQCERKKVENIYLGHLRRSSE